MFMVSPGSSLSSAASILLMLSITLSGPLLALNLLFRSPIPIPTDLFETYSEPPSAVLRAPSPQSTAASSYKYSHEYKRSGSVTVVESRRSTDVWLTNGDAVDGKSKMSRALGMLQPKPKLSVLPPEGEQFADEPLTPPLPMQMQPERSLPATPAQSERSAEFGRTPGRLRKESKASSYYSGTSDSVAFQTQIMIAQRHYSALAQTIAVPPSPTAPVGPERRASMDDSAAASGIETKPVTRASQHLRVRSVSSITGNTSVDSRFPVSPPPASPLPPTPPSVRERKARMLSHRKSHSQSSSSAGFSFGPIAGDDMAEIDALSARVLPLLVPGLTVGNDIRVREDWSWNRSPREMKATGTMKSSKTVPVELGGYSTDFSSPDGHSTPLEQQRKTAPRERKTSNHRRNHFSLPRYVVIAVLLKSPLTELLPVSLLARTVSTLCPFGAMRSTAFLRASLASPLRTRSRRATAAIRSTATRASSFPTPVPTSTLSTRTRSSFALPRPWPRPTANAQYRQGPSDLSRSVRRRSVTTGRARATLLSPSSRLSIRSSVLRSRLPLPHPR